MTLVRQALLAVAAVTMGWVGAGQAQDYPARPVIIVAGGAAGGPTDVIARIVAESMTRHMPQPVLVENTAPAHLGAQRSRPRSTLAYWRQALCRASWPGRQASAPSHLYRAQQRLVRQREITAELIELAAGETAGRESRA